MIKKSFSLRTFKDYRNLIDFLDEDMIDTNIVVTVSEEDTRHNAQNRLFHHWNREIAEQYGETPEYIRDYNKFWFLTRVYEDVTATPTTKKQEEMKQDLKYMYEIIDAINDSGLPYTEREERWFHLCNKELHTSYLTVKQFSDFLNRIQYRWTAEGYNLTTSDDLYFDAIHGKRQ